MRKPGVGKEHNLVMKLSRTMQQPTVVKGGALGGRELKNNRSLPLADLKRESHSMNESNDPGIQARALTNGQQDGNLRNR